MIVRTIEPTLGKPKYGVDAPGVISGFAAGAGAALVGLGALWLLAPAGWPAFFAAAVLALALLTCVMLGGSMLLYAALGKFRMREKMLRRIVWRGDERVLDIGAGAGLLMIGAAKRAPRGRAFGVDIWRKEDLSSNSLERAARNVAIEGVEPRVELHTADARELPFPNRYFDAVVSLLCIHNIEEPGGQSRACREIARVLKPGGKALIADYVPTHAYGATLTQAGLRAGRSRTCFATALGPMWLVEADKPLEGALAP